MLAVVAEDPGVPAPRLLAAVPGRECGAALVLERRVVDVRDRASIPEPPAEVDILVPVVEPLVEPLGPLELRSPDREAGARGLIYVLRGVIVEVEAQGASRDGVRRPL